MKKAYFKYILSLLIFGTNGLVASKILLSSYEIVFFRTFIGSIMLTLLFLISRQPLTFTKNKSQLVYIIISGVSMGLSWMFLYEAYKHIGVSFSTLAYNIGPVIVMALSPVIFKEKLTLQKIVGFIAVIIGILLVNGKLVNEGGSIWGIICGFLSALTYAFMVIFNKKATKITGLENSAIQLITSFVTVAIFIGAKEHFAIRITSESLPYILVLGLINTGFGCYLYFSSLSKLPVQTVSVCGYLESLSAVIFSVILLHEIIKPLQIIGAVLILGGAVFAEISKTKQPVSRLLKFTYIFRQTITLLQQALS